jgi:hypothetical protein
LVIEPLILTIERCGTEANGCHTPTRPPSAGYYQAFNVPIRRSAVALLLAGKPVQPRKIHDAEGAAKARGRRRPDLAKQADRPGISPDSAAAGGDPAFALKAAAIAGNIRDRRSAAPATFGSAQALVICSLPRR